MGSIGGAVGMCTRFALPLCFDALSWKMNSLLGSRYIPRRGFVDEHGF